MKTYFTADPHFGHENIIRFCSRPFKDKFDMTKQLIERHNSKVTNRDTVKILGDFVYGLSDKETLEIFNALNGNKELIIGNHDLDRKGNLIQSIYRLPWAKPPTHYDEVKYNGNRIILSHYAALTWNGSHHGSLMAYGHSHNNLLSLPGSVDVGVDAQDYFPISVDEFLVQAKATLVNAPERISRIKKMLDETTQSFIDRAEKIKITE